MKLWITACDADRRVILNETNELESVRAASQWAQSVVPQEHHGSICITDEDNNEVADADGVNVVATSSYKTGHVYSDGKEQRAIAYTINGKAVISLPARLNGGRIPDLDECADIVSGWSVEDAMEKFNHAQYVALRGKVKEACAEFAANGFLPDVPRVDLSKPYAPPHVAPGPYEDSRVIMDRIGARIAAASCWPFDEHETCDDCGAHVESIIGCPDGAEVCMPCFDAGAH